jgi:glutaconate CoA-transferase, subunit B
MGGSPMPEPGRLLVMIAAIARLLDGLGHVAVGAASPVPAAAALLARELSGSRLIVSILGSERHNPFTDGGRELFDCAAQGRLDAFFLSGVQIDASGAVNLLGLGSPEALSRRYLGNFGAPYLASLVPNVILFRTDHGPRTLVETVDFVTAPGREGRRMVTDRGVFVVRDGRFVLESRHDGETLDGLAMATGFKFAVASSASVTPAPDARMRALLKETVAGEMAEIYPAFAARLADALRTA